MGFRHDPAFFSVLARLMLAPVRLLDDEWWREGKPACNREPSLSQTVPGQECSSGPGVGNAGHGINLEREISLSCN